MTYAALDEMFFRMRTQNTLQLYWNHTSAWVFNCKFAAYFQNTFYQEHLWKAASGYMSYRVL